MAAAARAAYDGDGSQNDGGATKHQDYMRSTVSGVLSFTYSLISFQRSCVLRRSNLIKDDPMHGLYGLENLAFNARRSSNTQRIFNSEKMLHYMCSPLYCTLHF